MLPDYGQRQWKDRDLDNLLYREKIGCPKLT